MPKIIFRPNPTPPPFVPPTPPQAPFAIRIRYTPEMAANWEAYVTVLRFPFLPEFGAALAIDNPEYPDYHTSLNLWLAFDSYPNEVYIEGDGPYLNSLYYKLRVYTDDTLSNYDLYDIDIDFVEEE